MAARPLNTRPADCADDGGEGTFSVIATAADTAGFRPELRRLYDYWVAIAPPGRLPGRAHFDPLAIPDLLPILWLLDVHGTPRRFRYRLVGTQFANLHGIDPTGRWLDEAFNASPIGNFVCRLQFCVDNRLPTWRRGIALVGHGFDWQTFETLTLPLASDGSDVDMVLGATLRHRVDAPTA